MPTLRSLAQYAVPIGAQVAGGVINRRAVGNATKTLTAGVDQATGTINDAAQQSRRTMADVYKEQKDALQPYQDTGAITLPGLKEGVAPGGEFNKPFNNDTFELYKDPGFQFRLSEGTKAIEAGANAGGTRFSGATLKALNNYAGESASQEYTAANQRYQQDTQGRFNRTMDVAGIGERATAQEVQAGSQYGANLSRLNQTTAAQIADLQTDKASAEAAGDVAKANSITDTINGILATTDNVGTARSMASLGGGALGSVAAPSAAATGATVPLAATAPSLAAQGTVGAALAGTTMAAAAPSAAAVMSGAVPEIALGASAGMAAPTLAAAPVAGSIAGGGAAAGGGGLLGLGSATIPVVGGLILGGALLAKHYVGAGRHQADVLTGEGGLNNAFEKTLAQIDADPNFTPDQKWQGKVSAYDELEKRVLEFSRKGKNQHKVSVQMFDTISPLFGRPNPLRGV